MLGICWLHIQHISDNHLFNIVVFPVKTSMLLQYILPSRNVVFSFLLKEKLVTCSYVGNNGLYSFFIAYVPCLTIPCLMIRSRSLILTGIFMSSSLLIIIPVSQYQSFVVQILFLVIKTFFSQNVTFHKLVGRTFI